MVKFSFEFFFGNRKKGAITVLALLFVLLVLYALFFQAPSGFIPKSTFSIEDGSSVSGIAAKLDTESYIRSPLLFKILTRLTGTNDNIIAGDYYFHTRLNLFALLKRLRTGDYGLTPVTVRIPEGSTTFEIAEILGNVSERFDKEKFLERTQAEDAEGYLFPDTYFFLPNVDENKVYDTLRENFDNKVVEVLPQIEAFGIPLNDAVIMASIIEKEAAHDFEERKIISGILWNRINIGMALQVDATFAYINGKNTFELSTEDLKIDSPYNTYVYRGLPIGPIASPSLESLIAAVTPTETDYFFYLHDLGGNVHYSITFEGHKTNKFKYLR